MLRCKVQESRFSSKISLRSRSRMIHVLHAATLQTPPHFGQNKLRLQGCGCVLYGVTGCFWLPVVWMQMRMRDLAETAASKGVPLPPAYHRLFWLGSRRLSRLCGGPKHPVAEDHAAGLLVPIGNVSAVSVGQSTGDHSSVSPPSASPGHGGRAPRTWRPPCSRLALSRLLHVRVPRRRQTNQL